MFFFFFLFFFSPFKHFHSYILPWGQCSKVARLHTKIVLAALKRCWCPQFDMFENQSMKVLRNIKDLREWRYNLFMRYKSVGFVPTMGALHAGHLSLISESLKENDTTIVSIFVNPAQFGPLEDLDQYPRTLDEDLEKLRQLKEGKVNAVFIPKLSEMYPSGVPLDVSKQRGAFVTVQGCSEQLEGSQRPQFFRGVATIVTKLLNLIRPTRAYFGQKDAQQCIVVKNLVKDLLIDTTIRVLPTVREPNGLALSSRNAYLSDDIKNRSDVVYHSLNSGKEYYEKCLASKKETVDSQHIRDVILGILNAASLPFSLEYLAVSDPETLDDLEAVTPSRGALVSIALRIKNKSGGETRLIDNVILDKC